MQCETSLATPPLQLAKENFSSKNGGDMKTQFTAVYEKRDKWYVGYVEEIPGVNTQGRTLAEAKRNLKEALNLILAANRDLSQKYLKAEEIVREPILVGTGK